MNIVVRCSQLWETNAPLIHRAPTAGSTFECGLLNLLYYHRYHPTIGSANRSECFDSTYYMFSCLSESKNVCHTAGRANHLLSPRHLVRGGGEMRDGPCQRLSARWLFRVRQNFCKVSRETR
ncbi:hypothetical protein [Nannocystis pusilla]|uniref:hypothetical protein n=1 Tax=Nannocystis pusilla TaxID=889268 RepID=UPI003B7626B6